MKKFIVIEIEEDEINSHRVYEVESAVKAAQKFEMEKQKELLGTDDKEELEKVVSLLQDIARVGDRWYYSAGDCNVYVIELK